MKNTLFVTIFFLALSWTHIAAQNSVPPNGAEISFTLNRQRGFSSNQFAVWIEDSRGSLVKTLYATKFTATGGWAKRPQSIPIWVVKSDISDLSKNDIDAFTGATPRSGLLSYRWDGLDKNGTRAAAGEYRVFLEATLRAENRVLFSAPFTLGNTNLTEPAIRSQYFGSSTKERGMVENVKVVYH